MRKKLVLITNDELVKESNYADLLDVFGDIIDIEAYSLERYIKPRSIEGDLVLSVTSVELERISPFLKHDIEVFHGNRTILSESYDRLKALPPGTRALVISTNLLFTSELTMFLTRCGINQVKFMPIYRELPELPEADVVIVPQELPELMDIKGIPKISLGKRRITDETYRAVAFSLGIEEGICEDRIREKTKNLVKLSTTDVPLSKICALEDMLKATLKEIDDGVVITTIQGKIVYINRSFFKMLNMKHDYKFLDNIKSNTVYEELYKIIVEQGEVENEILDLKSAGKSLLVTRKKVYSREKETRFISIFKDVTKIENLETKIRGALRQQTYKAKYTFNDIIGESAAIKETLEKAKRIAGFEKTCLILGESGTGKEMVAQAMHNISGRRKMPFVAINCAALSSELIESELFGYEEGTFTGAKKGGKRGLFEIAHNGTIFLDEIGTIPPDIQMKLLRVLQEQEVRRIGGEGIIPVNVWVIAATNCDLAESVGNGMFRLDLYYRLNVFPIMIPPLRKREKDAAVLIRHMVHTLNKEERQHKQVKQELFDVFLRYPWPGNIRELQNTVEFIYYMGENEIGLEALPDTLKVRLAKARPSEDGETGREEKMGDSTGRRKDPDLNTGDIPMEIARLLTREEEIILREILMVLKGRRMGRRSLLKLLKERGYEISEYKLRKFLAMTEEYKLLK